ncbi:SAM-dependent methyltransferase [Paractinoplanes deccanensis]|uniref:SAM-dependent methyltransferase n=1 Tax=Paractinoplanes deccanensis TaxID=113561 RepID=A0ABQ3YCJ7_9ACTN|nr:class I SAM-dependent methyltransferase [Actinoplanes deccanensis]GID77720.1 SAM-dependent methyltransferase [Actinoplanes deccanensis]
MTTTMPAPATDTLAERVVSATTAALELYGIHLGRRLDLYAELAEEPLTYPQLARRAGIAPRYAREWLEQQAVAGILHTSPEDPAEARRYALPEAYRPVLLEADHPAHVAPLADMVAGIAGVLGRLPDAYRTGAGVPYAAYGTAFRRGQGGINRPMFANDLPGWLAALPDVSARLATAPLARVADIGCGEGWSSVALARQLPKAAVDGYDSDPASVEAARRHAAEAGLNDRVRFHTADATTLAGPYDLILIFEALHDLARPDLVLRAAREALADGGTVLVADERVADSFTAPGDDVERLMYGWSITHCLPAALTENPSAALGTALRAGTVHALAREAGFHPTEPPIANDFLRFYRLDPAERSGR